MKGPEPVISQIIDKLKHINQVCCSLASRDGCGRFPNQYDFPYTVFGLSQTTVGSFGCRAGATSAPFVASICGRCSFKALG